jgi:predicted tellurium resistance membrane protein TerC
MKAQRWISLVAGVILLLIGILWTLQGSNVITGSGMSGQKLWFLIGLVAAVVGIVLLVTGARRSSKKTS